MPVSVNNLQNTRGKEFAPTHHHEGNKVDEEDLRDRSPSERVLERSSRWPRDGTETCGGVKRVSRLPLGFSKYMRIYRPENEVGGAARGPQAIRACPPRARPVGLWGPGVAPGFLPNLPGLLFVQKNHQKVSWQLDFVWYCKPEK